MIWTNNLEAATVNTFHCATCCCQCSFIHRQHDSIWFKKAFFFWNGEKGLFFMISWHHGALSLNLIPLNELSRSVQMLLWYIYIYIYCTLSTVLNFYDLILATEMLVFNSASLMPRREHSQHTIILMFVKSNLAKSEMCALCWLNCIISTQKQLWLWDAPYGPLGQRLTRNSKCELHIPIQKCFHEEVL